MLVIHKSNVEHIGDRARLQAPIEVDGESREVWFDVPDEYEPFLCREKSDPFVIGLINWAMRHGHNIKCDSPMTEELLYQIKEYLIPSLANSSKLLKNIDIAADIDANPVVTAGAVGTGISCGIDSFHVLACQTSSQYKNLNLTHLLHHNVGSFGVYGTNADTVRNQTIERATNLANSLGIQLIISNSNFANVFPQNYSFTHTFSTCFAVQALQKLWSVYFYASAGHDFSEFKLKNNERLYSSNYDLLNLECFSTKSLRFYSEGGAKTRFEKTRAVCGYSPAHENLHVCLTSATNCGKCMKCRRTLVTLDALNQLDVFGNVFDIEYYKKHRNEYYIWIIQSYLNGDTFIKEPFQCLSKNFTGSVWFWGIFGACYLRCRQKLAKIEFLRLLMGKGKSEQI